MSYVTQQLEFRVEDARRNFALAVAKKDEDMQSAIIDHLHLVGLGGLAEELEMYGEENQRG